MYLSIYIFLLIPALGLLLSLFMPARNEQAISWTVFGTNGLAAIYVTAWIVYWLLAGAPDIVTPSLTLYASDIYDFELVFFFDRVTAVYLGFTSILSYLISLYSRYYLHRERGYKRYFITIMLFVVSIDIIVLSGNFETLFFGWEVLGISSFMLIAYYRDRYLPVRNALKVYSVYRIADVGLLLTMWLSHHLWHANITFDQLNNSEAVSAHLESHYGVGIVIALLIGLAAAAKSAQFPFSAWLARAMEGPTPSSAIFYGSVAVHIGVFLMLRTYPFWQGIIEVKVFYIVMGLITAFMASQTAEVQSSVKAQIAYASIAQIAVIFIEVALGLHTLALIHMTGNAFLRAYQLLVSPSIVTYHMREQFFNYEPLPVVELAPYHRRWRSTLLVAGLKEWRLDTLLYKYAWSPLKAVGKWGDKLPTRMTLLWSLALFVGFMAVLIADLAIPDVLHYALAVGAGVIGLVLALNAFAERRSVLRAWTFLTACHLWLVVAVGLNDGFSPGDTLFYLSGIAVAAVAGYLILRDVLQTQCVDLNDFYGLVKHYRAHAFGFLLSCLAMAGFPITTTFLGEDLLFTHIHQDQMVLAMIVSLIFVVDGIAVIRMYARVFLGPYRAAEETFAGRYS